MSPTSSRFFCLEGIDGSGKTTQLTLLQEELARRGYQAVRVREPGGTDISEKVRNILLSPVHKGKMGDMTELLLYNAARAQVIEEIIKPALSNGRVVLADRFAWSTMAYQGFGRGLDTRLIESLLNITCGDYWPRHTFILDIPVAASRERMEREDRAPDRLEQEKNDFFERVRDGYRHIAIKFPDRCSLLDATRSPIAIQQDIVRKVIELIKEQ